jgi:hypothetical protein
VHLALVPVCRRNRRGQGGDLRARRIHGDEKRNEPIRCTGRGGLEDVAHLQIAVRRRDLVGRHDRRQRHRLRSGENGGRRREIARARQAHREVAGTRAGTDLNRADGAQRSRERGVSQ